MTLEQQGIIFDKVVERIKRRFPGIGDESGELDHETVVLAVLTIATQEVHDAEGEETNDRA